MATRKELEDQAAKLQAELKVVQNKIVDCEYEEFLDDKKEIIAKWDMLRENKDFLISLFEHSRTSCSDKLLANGWYEDFYDREDGKLTNRCTKCALMDILNGKVNPERPNGDIIAVRFSIDFDIIENPQNRK